MKRIQGILLSGVLLMAGCSTPKDASVTTVSIKDMINRYTEVTDEKSAYETAYTLSYDEAYLSNDLGFRTAGSDAEHAAADYIAKRMEKLGLSVEKVPVTVDKWQFNDAELTIDGTDISIMPASYATNGTDEKGIHAEIVDVGTGNEVEYLDVDVKDKIALVGVDQWNVAWIDQYMNEAYYNGAAAVVTYDVGGYATYSDDMINMQDLCANDNIPCVSISKNQYLEISEAIENGKNMAHLTVDNVMEPDQGTSYNVVGKLEGKSHDQQIIISGHYDVYFNGFQDDSAAIGLVLGIAEGMQKSGYTPENDILFIAHGAEEWGAIGSQFDWTTGAWEMINNAHPEWADKTIAMINFELPAFYDGLPQSQISCVPEYARFVKYLVEDTDYLKAPVNNIYPEGISSVSVDTNTMEDGVSYRGSGVPYFINIPGTKDGEEGWIQQRYHTVKDDADTYSADVMATNLNTYGALAIAIDQLPAIPLDFTATCEDLMEVNPLVNEDYDKTVAAFKEAAEAHNTKIAQLNEKYIEALQKGADEEELTKMREEGKQLNQISLSVFKHVQDELIGIISTSTVVIKHAAYLSNIEILDGIIDALENDELANEDETGALDLAWQLNGGTEYGYYNFSVETNAESKQTLLEEQNPGNVFWGTNKGSVHTDTYKATISLIEKAAEEHPDFSAELAVYKKEKEKQQALLQETVSSELKAIEQLIKGFQ